MFDKSSAADDIRNAGNDFQVPLDHPVLNASQLGCVQGIALQIEAEDFADGTRQRADFRLYAIRQLGVLQPLQNLLPGEVIVDSIVKCDVYE